MRVTSLVALPLLALLPALSTAADATAPVVRLPVPRLALWMEPSANLLTLSTPEGVREALDRARASGVDVVMPEAKNAWGYVTYPSEFAPAIDTSPLAHFAPPAYPPPVEWYPRGYDMLSTIIREAHARGMRVDAAVNTFSEGYSPLGAGPAFSHPEWQATAYVATRRIVTPDGQSYALSGVNIPRGQDDLILYTPAIGATTPTSRWGVDVAISAGMVQDVRDRTAEDAEADPDPLPIPRNGYVLSGNGTAAEWLRRALAPGMAVALGPVETKLEPSSARSEFAFVSPANPEVWNYELAVILEIITHYDVDGIVLDRTRYQDIAEDFSAPSRAGFEAFIGYPVAHWPEDVYTYVPRGVWVARRPGPLYRAWLGYRAHTILAFTRAVTHLVHTLKPHVAVAMYVGAWYPVYYSEGVNWASPEVQPPYAWIGEDWVRAGLAPLLDYIMIGLYYRPVTMWEALRHRDDPTISIQGGALLGLSLVRGATPVVGSLLVSLYAQDPDRLARAVRMTRALTQGTMLFDLVYLTVNDLWPAVPAP